MRLDYRLIEQRHRLSKLIPFTLYTKHIHTPVADALNMLTDGCSRDPQLSTQHFTRVKIAIG
ncbi:Uncharacterised protein [Vibrio cholerae]|nr:Uncharacterised protein [Vibrio cholerae]